MRGLTIYVNNIEGGELATTRTREAEVVDGSCLTEFSVGLPEKTAYEFVFGSNRFTYTWAELESQDFRLTWTSTD